MDTERVQGLWGRVGAALSGTGTGGGGSGLGTPASSSQPLQTGSWLPREPPPRFLSCLVMRRWEGAGFHVAWREVVLTVCTWGLCVGCAGGAARRCVHTCCKYPACGFTHLSHCGEQMCVALCAASLGLVLAWASVSSGWRDVLPTAGLCRRGLVCAPRCWQIGACVATPRSLNPRSTLIQLPVVTLDSISSLLQTHHDSSWSPRPCMDPVIPPSSLPSICPSTHHSLASSPLASLLSLEAAR